MRLAVFLIVLGALWLLLSGIFTLLQLSFGVLTCVFVTWLTMHLGLGHRHDHRIYIVPRLPMYAVWLFWEIVKSNLHVARALLSRDPVWQRQLIRIKPSQRTDYAVAIFANSITLTPGTLTMDAENGELLVHALTDAVAQDLESGEMDRQVSRLEGSS